MYQFLMSAHSHTRWLILLAGGIAVLLPFINKAFDKKAKLPALIFLIICDVQFLMGIILYFFYSPFGIAAFENGMGFVMKTGEIRKIAVEHFALMLLAIALVHIGYRKIKLALDAQTIKKTSLIYFGLALLFILAGIPWSRL